MLFIYSIIFYRFNLIFGLKMDIQTRLKNSEFRKEVLGILQASKIHDKVEGSKFINEIPVSQIQDIYMVNICKLIQDIEFSLSKQYMIKNNTKLLHDIVILALCKARKGKNFDDYYDEIIADIEKNLKLSNKIFIEI